MKTFAGLQKTLPKHWRDWQAPGFSGKGCGAFNQVNIIAVMLNNQRDARAFKGYPMVELLRERPRPGWHPRISRPDPLGHRPNSESGKNPFLKINTPLEKICKIQKSIFKNRVDIRKKPVVNSEVTREQEANEPK